MQACDAVRYYIFPKKLPHFLSAQVSCTVNVWLQKNQTSLLAGSEEGKKKIIITYHFTLITEVYYFALVITLQ